jgi:hypothetical protein
LQTKTFLPSVVVVTPPLVVVVAPPAVVVVAPPEVVVVVPSSSPWGWVVVVEA